MVRTFGMAYGAKPHISPFITGEVGKAPAWYFMSASAATILPSFVTPILIVIEAPDVGPVALKVSSRVIWIFTGWPDFRESKTAACSPYTPVFPPKPPPISAQWQRR